MISAFGILHWFFKNDYLVSDRNKFLYTGFRLFHKIAKGDY